MQVPKAVCCLYTLLLVCLVLVSIGLEEGFTNEKSFEFHHPEVTLSGWHEVIIQLITQKHHTHAPMRACMHARMHAHTHAHAHTHTHKHIHTHTHTHTQAHIHTQAHTYAHARTHTHTQLHTYSAMPLYLTILIKVCDKIIKFKCVQHFHLIVASYFLSDDASDQMSVL